MVEVLLLGREGCVGRMCQGMLLLVDILPPMWRGRNYCLRSEKSYRNTYGVIDFRVS